MNPITVKVTKHGDRKYLVMYYDDPMTGQRVQRSTKKANRREAEREAAKWEAELREGRYKPASNIGWEEFRERFEDEVLPALAYNTAVAYTTAFNSLQRALNGPQKLRDVNAERLSYFQRKLRDDGLSEATVACYLRHLKAALRWAVNLGMLAEVPKVKMPKRTKGAKIMKGRPITTEEFERMLDKVESGLLVVAVLPTRKSKGKQRFSDAVMERRRDEQRARVAKISESWRHLLNGLWLSGLRIGEAVNLYWDDESKLCVDLTGRRPMFRIRAEFEKGFQDRLLPMTPDFAELLQQTPEAEQTGPIFRPLKIASGDACSDVHWLSKVVSCIGKAAGVKVDTDSKTGKVKYASAHDLRRSFGARWAPRVMPIVLQQLMRHESIDTTLRYYVGHNAEATADAIWEAAQRVGTFVGTSPISSTGSASKKPQVLTDSRLSECPLMDSNHQPSD